MDIKYLGHSSFLIRSKKTKLVTDPYDSEMVGLKFPRVEADIVTVSHQHKDHNKTENIKGNPLVINFPGEFEKQGMRIYGYSSFHDKKDGQERGNNILYKIEVDDISILHCGDLGFVPNDKFINKIGGVDILMVPVGGFYTIDADEAIVLMKRIEPSIVIPMHYNNSQLNQKVFEKIAPLSKFLEKVDGENITPIPKLVVKKDELDEEMRVVVLDNS